MGLLQRIKDMSKKIKDKPVERDGQLINLPNLNSELYGEPKEKLITFINKAFKPVASSLEGIAFSVSVEIDKEGNKRYYFNDTEVSKSVVDHVIRHINKKSNKHPHTTRHTLNILYAKELLKEEGGESYE